MATINVTLRLVKKYFESNPVWTTWEQMQINKVEFHISDPAGLTLLKVDVPITGTASEFVSSSVVLEQNTDYEVLAVAFSPFHPAGVKSTKIAFNTGDPATYYNYETVIIDGVTQLPIVGAVLTFDAVGLNIVKNSRHDGLVWIQRIPAGSYTVAVTKEGYTPVNVTYTAGGFVSKFIVMTPV